MVRLTAYSSDVGGLMAHRLNDSYHSFSTGLSFNTNSAPIVESEVSYTLFHNLVLAFSLALSMASISSGLSISIRKKKMKAKFNRQAYASSIQTADNKEHIKQSIESYSFKDADYSYHIKDSVGKVLPCSEAWFK